MITKRSLRADSKMEHCANVKRGLNALFIICLASRNISFVTLRMENGWEFGVYPSISNATETERLCVEMERAH